MLRPALRARRCAALALSALAAVALAAPARASVPADTLGVFTGPGDPAAVANFEGRIGHPVAIVHDFLSRESWAKIEDAWWWTATWGASAYKSRMLFSVPMLPDGGGVSLAAGAAGQYDEHFKALARSLVAGGQGSAILRLGPEFNGNWSSWTIAAPNGPTDFAAYWRRIVNAMRSVSGANFKFDWCAASGSSYVNGRPLDAQAAYPGDAYVDYIGLDIYDQSWISNRSDPQARWNGYLDQPAGLRWHRDFAAARGKPMTFPEWGLAVRTDGYGGGDSPEFVGYMHDWIAANNVAYHAYFNYADGIIDARIFNGLFPTASQRFVTLFGAGAATPPPPPPPPATTPPPTKKKKR